MMLNVILSLFILLKWKSCLKKHSSTSKASLLKVFSVFDIADDAQKIDN